jgi:hypothetical protein
MLYLAYIAIFLIIFFSRRAHFKSRAEDRNADETLYGDHLEALDSYFKFIRRNKEKKAVSITIRFFDIQNIVFMIKREKWYHRLLKYLNLATELNSGDDRLDWHTYILADHPDHMQGVVKNQHFIKAVEELFFNHQIDELRCIGNTISVNSIIRDGETEKEKEKSIAKNLYAIKKIINEQEIFEYAQPYGSRTVRFAFGFMALHFALLILGLSSLFGNITISTLAIPDVKAFNFYAGYISLAAMGLWLFAIITTIGRTAWSALVIVDFILFGIIGIFLSTNLAMREINARLDQSPLTIAQSKIVYKSCQLKCRSTGRSVGRRSTIPIVYTYNLTPKQCLPQNRGITFRYYAERYSECRQKAYFNYKLHIKKWHSSMNISRFSFETDEAEFDRTLIGQKVDVPYNQGFLNFIWLDTANITVK